MNGRTPTQAERLYIEGVIAHVGCIACRLRGDVLMENTELWCGFHHDPDYGSRRQFAHFHGYSLCAACHQPVERSKLPEGHVYRHGKDWEFFERYGSDAELCAVTWGLLPDSVIEKIGFSLIREWPLLDEVIKQAIGFDPQTGEIIQAA